MLLFVQENWKQILLSSLFGYFLGSINFAILITKYKKAPDIRTMGSKNAGFTNVFRSVGKRPAIFTLIFDLIKGLLAVGLGWLFFSTVTADTSVLAKECVTYGKYISGLFCILGHMFPIYFHFKGGKGVVTSVALILLTDWRVFCLIIITFFIAFIVTKIISLSVIICGVLFGPYTFLIVYYFDYIGSKNQLISHPFNYVIAVTACAIGISALVIIKHKDNIKRLLKGEEKKITKA